MKEKSLPMAIGLNILLPGLGYMYMGKWIVGILTGFLIFAVYATFGLYWLLPAWLVFNAIMALDMVILFNKNKKEIADATTSQCPYCAEIIKKEAKICRFCHSNITSDTEVAS